MWGRLECRVLVQTAPFIHSTICTASVTLVSTVDTAKHSAGEPCFHGTCILEGGRWAPKQAKKNVKKITLDSGPCQEDNKLGDEMESDKCGAGWKEAWGSWK